MIGELSLAPFADWIFACREPRDVGNRDELSGSPVSLNRRVPVWSPPALAGAAALDRCLSAVAAAHAPLNVTVFSTARVWGGAEEQTRLLAEGLRASGHTCRFVARRNSPVASRMAAAGFPTLQLSGTGRNPVSLWRARRLLRSHRSQVLHFVDPHAVTVGGLASWGMNVPARVYVRHNPFPIRRVSRYRWVCDRVICVCGAVAEVCCRSGLPASMLRVVPNGCTPASDPCVDRSELRRRLQLDPNAFVLLTAAHMNACKGHAYLLQAMPAVFRTHPEARLALLGSGPLEEELRRQAQSLGIAARVDFLGFRADVRQFMRAADLLVLPSLAEGVSAVLLEAMSERCPIVATAVGGTPELLRATEANSGRTIDEEVPLAWVVPPADVAALQAAVLEALADPQTRLQRALRGEQVAKAEYAAETMVARTLAVYREVIEEQVHGRCRSAS